MQDFRISLNSTTNVFFANSEVRGTVYLKTASEMKARKIKISIIGRAKTSFHHQRGKHTHYYSSTRSYLENELSVWKCQNGSNKIAAGCYQFPFKFVIPANCPPNMSAQFGNIRYYVKAIIDVPWALDKSFILGFSVCPYIDLNANARLAMPAINYTQKTGGVFSSKAVKVTLRMPKMGFVCGEIIPIHVSIENESTTVIKSVESGIGATYIFTATDNTVFQKHTMTKKVVRNYCVKDASIPVDMTQTTVFTRCIQIPPLPPSFDHCDIIKLQYHIFIKVHTSAVFSRGASASMPLVIGTVPLWQPISREEPSFIGFEAYMQPPPPGIPPPDYEFKDANFREGEVEEKSGNKDDEPFTFQPKFPCYSDLIQSNSKQ